MICGKCTHLCVSLFIHICQVEREREDGIKTLRNILKGAGEMSPLIRTLAAVLEDSGLISNAYMTARLLF